MQNIEYPFPKEIADNLKLKPDEKVIVMSKEKNSN